MSKFSVYPFPCCTFIIAQVFTFVKYFFALSESFFYAIFKVQLADGLPSPLLYLYYSTGFHFCKVLFALSESFFYAIFKVLVKDYFLSLTVPIL
nr:MAG TPA: hypothetical protein [Caudoviricetes sp.]